MLPFKMIHELASYMSKQSEIPIILDESKTFQIKSKISDVNTEYTLYIRSETDATTNSSNGALYHGPSAKIMNRNNQSYEIHFNSHDPIDFSVLYEKSAGLSPRQRQFVKSFMCDNQAVLSAYWYTKNVSPDIFEQYIQDRYDSIDYTSKKINQKTLDQLMTDRETITNYMREKTGDKTLVLNFGKDPVDKKTKKRR